MTRYLILVRHSISRQDPTHAAHEWTLTSAGMERCQLLAAQLRPYQADRVITSLEPKARLTSQLLAAALQIPVESETDLREHQRATAPYLASKAAFDATIHKLLTNPDQLIFGEETGTQARTRFQQAVTRILAHHPDKTLIATTHGTVLSLFLAHVAQVDPVAFWQKLGMPGYVVLELPDFKVASIVYEVTT